MTDEASTDPIAHVHQFKHQASVYKNEHLAGSAAGRYAAQVLIGGLQEKEFVHLMLAAAPSQQVMLATLAQQAVPWHRVKVFHLDEYVGLSSTAEQRFANWIRRAFVDAVPVAAAYFIDPGADSEREAARYGELLKEMPPDVVCLGIGENGHLAFNEPGDWSASGGPWARCIELDARSRQQQVTERCFERLDDVPEQAVTVTVPALLSAPTWVVTVVGDHKASAVAAAIDGPISAQCPASSMRLHPNAHLFLDQAAAARSMLTTMALPDQDALPTSTGARP